MILFFRNVTIFITLFCAAGLLASCTATPARSTRIDSNTPSPATVSAQPAPTTVTEKQKLNLPEQRHPTTQERVEQLQKDQLQAFTEKCTYSTPTTKQQRSTTKQQRPTTKQQRPTPNTPPVTQKPITAYTVQTGENLYSITARANIYNEGLLWPLIYKANRDQIKDPQQIFPGQTLTITRNHTEYEKEQARETARKSGIFKQQHENEQTTPLSTR